MARYADVQPRDEGPPTDVVVVPPGSSWVGDLRRQTKG